MASNFEFLEKNFPVLADYGRKAENYLYSDSNSCLMKLGMIGETIVNLIFKYDRVPIPYDNTAVIRIDTLYREGLIDTEIQDILHSLRKARNKAVHENYSSVEDGKSRADGLQPLRLVLSGIWGLQLSAGGFCHAFERRNSDPGYQ